ncbi:transmembrane signal receptor [Lithospermum erythrorhizon]|uniref:Transmembrane signal receptor n=1 Tax=Lithospermum erythrorhizon TaxID=34254 RepID=A0AAV3R3P3_LITER
MSSGTIIAKDIGTSLFILFDISFALCFPLYVSSSVFASSSSVSASSLSLKWNYNTRRRKEEIKDRCGKVENALIKPKRGEVKALFGVKKLKRPTHKFLDAYAILCFLLPPSTSFNHDLLHSIKSNNAPTRCAGLGRYTLPRNPVSVLNDPNWKLAMTDEYNALIENRTWELVPSPPNVNVIRSMWIFRHKEHSDGSFERHKARLVGDGKTQQIGIDCGETFSPVIKPATIGIVLSLALSKKWSIHQLDIKNVFLHGDLQETIYMHQTLGFRDPSNPYHVCLLRKSLYGLKQAPRAWYQRFVDYVASIGFHHNQFDNSLFIFQQDSEMAYLLLYVDDIILTTSSDTLRKSC